MRLVTKGRNNEIAPKERSIPIQLAPKIAVRKIKHAAVISNPFKIRICPSSHFNLKITSQSLRKITPISSEALFRSKLKLVAGCKQAWGAKGS